MLAKKTLILDCDNVTIDWSLSVIPFLISRGKPISDQLRADVQNEVFFDLVELNKFFEKGFLHEYHRSEFASEMYPMDKKLPRYLIELKEHYNLVALTSFSNDPKAMENRRANIEKYFPDTFSEVIVLYAQSPKEEALIELNKRLDIAFFVDDNLKHVKEGQRVLGLDKTIHFSGVFKNWAYLKQFLIYSANYEKHDRLVKKTA